MLFSRSRTAYSYLPSVKSCATLLSSQQGELVSVHCESPLHTGRDLVKILDFPQHSEVDEENPGSSFSQVRAARSSCRKFRNVLLSRIHRFLFLLPDVYNYILLIVA